jgi:signal transduction histidine kinase
MTENQKETRSLDELVQANELKSNLISISAHQLRTSLAALKWILKMLLDGDAGKLNSEQENLIKKGYESNERMITLVGEMLELAHRETTAGVAYHFEPENIVELIDETVFEFISESYKKGIELIFLKPDTSISLVKIDREKMRVVFENLIENAIKYSSKEDKIFISLKEEEGDIVISIKDTGMGIPEKDIPLLFGKFVRGSNTTSIPGTGLGLYTVKTVLDQHNGTIQVESTPENGTTFSITLPK